MKRKPLIAGLLLFLCISSSTAFAAPQVNTFERPSAGSVYTLSEWNTDGWSAPWDNGMSNRTLIDNAYSHTEVNRCASFTRKERLDRSIPACKPRSQSPPVKNIIYPTGCGSARTSAGERRNSRASWVSVSQVGRLARVDKLAQAITALARGSSGAAAAKQPYITITWGTGANLETMPS